MLSIPHLGIPSLRADLLSSVVPTQVYSGGWAREPSDLLFVWNSHKFTPQQLQGGVLCFYVDDRRFSALLRQPARYGKLFTGLGGLVELDCSVWRNRPLVEQLFAIYSIRSMSLYWQEEWHIPIIPNLAWGDKQTYEWCFAGIPQEPPVAACESRSVGRAPENRAYFNQGLKEAVRRLAPRTILIYGGISAQGWLELPPGPSYVLLPCWQSARHEAGRSEEANWRNRHRLQGRQAVLPDAAVDLFGFSAGQAAFEAAPPC